VSNVVRDREATPVGPRIAERIAHLGTETAFAVSAEAAAFGAQGNRVYPFHLGDLNIPTPDNVVEASFKAIRDGKTGYCPNAGIPELRAALAADVSASHGISYSAENVAIEPGGKPVIGKFMLALMNPGDEVLYPNPGYPIYESQIEFNGGVAVPYGYFEGEHGFVIDLEALEAARRRSWSTLPSSCCATTSRCFATRRTSTSVTRVPVPRSRHCPGSASAVSSSTRSPRSSP
jgi:aspartate/methionine/tyrosine aminotransferase